MTYRESTIYHYGPNGVYSSSIPVLTPGTLLDNKIIPNPQRSPRPPYSGILYHDPIKERMSLGEFFEAADLKKEVKPDAQNPNLVLEDIEEVD